MSAYACQPDRGSEPSVGWEFLRAAALRHQIVLLTLPRNIASIEKALLRERITSVEFVGVPGSSSLARHEGKLGLGHLDYMVWQWRALRRARTVVDRVDVAHHVTFGNDWLPCAMHFLPGVPVLWGPVGGFAPIPWRLIRFLSWRGALREGAREGLTRAVRAGTARLVRAQGCHVIAVNDATANRFEDLGVPVFVEPHVAMPPPPEVVDLGLSMSSDRRRRLIFAGRLTSWKGPYLSLETLCFLPCDWDLHIFGQGSEESALRRRSLRLGLSDRVHFRGAVPLEELRDELVTADALLFPSMHDAAPFTVAEAVRVGCPVACLDVGGPPMLIEGGAGIAVPPDRHAPLRLAQAVLAMERHQPSNRWNADRLVSVVDAWYRQVTATV